MSGEVDTPEEAMDYVIPDGFEDDEVFSKYEMDEMIEEDPLLNEQEQPLASYGNGENKEEIHREGDPKNPPSNDNAIPDDVGLKDDNTVQT